MVCMTAQLARQLMDAGMEKAAKDFGRPICISVCDQNGNLVAFCRMDAAPLRSIAIAQQKAYTAVRMGVSTEAFLARLRSDNIDIGYFCDPQFTAMPGGSPITDGQGRIIGAVGVSGLLASEDQMITTFLAGRAPA
jgi:glc operon protein GlcG